MWRSGVRYTIMQLFSFVHLQFNNLVYMFIFISLKVFPIKSVYSLKLKAHKSVVAFVIFTTELKEYKKLFII